MYCRHNHNEEVIALVSLTNGCVCFPQDKEQYLCEYHLNKLEDNGYLGKFKVKQYYACKTS